MLRQENNKLYNKQRGSAASQGYDGAWVKTRNAYIRKHCLCEMCEAEGKIVPAVLVHHKMELKDNGARLDPENLVSLCNQCHEKIHGPKRWERKG
jgi:5-methylcytosine-specific restriction protein A